MASLAAMLKDRGCQVTGSDEGAYAPMSVFLNQKQIRVVQGYSAANLQPEPDLIVVGNALSRGNPEIEYMLNHRLPHTSLPEAIKDLFLRRKIPVVVTGTHGKTTTTSMIAWVLHSAGLQPSFFMGGIAENFRSSYALEDGPHFIVEGDEYDSAYFDKGPKFLHYLPYAAVVGNVEYDHADIYPDLESIMLQFQRFVRLIPEDGFLAVGADCAAAQEVSRHNFCDKETFGLCPDSDWSAGEIKQEGDRLSFNILYRKKLFRRLSLGLYGTYNIRNALAAITVLHWLGASEDDICSGLETFKGVRRRLQLLAEVGGISIYEDFAHHPTAVRETLGAVREALHPARLWAIYEPRSATSRRKIFQREIAEALSLADCIALPALFKPEKVPESERLDEHRVIEDLHQKGRAAWNLKTIEDIIHKVCEEARAGDTIIILSNGGFGDICQKLPAALEKR